MFSVLVGALGALARDHTVVVPDLRGMGLSSHPAGGSDKRTQAAAWWRVGGLLLVSGVPFTLLVIMPTNKTLLDSSLDKSSAALAELLSRWAKLHAVRSLLSILALVLFLSLLMVSGVP
jgi:pimeloyl-ACP methyl ester carboxylesterase